MGKKCGNVYDRGCTLKHEYLNKYYVKEEEWI